MSAERTPSAEYPPVDPLGVLRAMRNEIGDWAADEIESLRAIVKDRMLHDLARHTGKCGVKTLPEAEVSYYVGDDFMEAHYAGMSVRRGIDPAWKDAAWMALDCDTRGES